ncbi:MAG TPA: ATP-binding protein [Stellaceae bacterium]|nr:ATP-binding protein [Stellaceae bacterium]
MRPTITATPEAARRARPPRMIAYGAAVLILVLMSVDGIAIWHLRQSAMENAENSLGKLNRVLEEQSVRTLQGADLVLNAVDAEFASAGIRDAVQFRRTASSSDAHLGLARKISGLPQISTLFLVDSSGVVLSTSGARPAHEINIHDRPDFIALRDHTDLGTVISAPITAQSNGFATIYLARRLSGLDGRFLGIVAAAIRLDYFENFYRDVSIGPGSAIALWRTDGALVTRYPAIGADTKAVLASPLTDSPLTDDNTPSAKFGPVRTANPVTGEPVILAGQRLGAYPLIATTSLTIDSILATWNIEASIVGAIGLILSVAIAAIAVLFRRQFVAQLMTTRAYARLADESQARRDLLRAVERAEAIAAERRLAQEALQHSERRFRDIAEFSADWIWESDVDHRFTFLSGDGSQAIFGKTRWEVAGADLLTDPYWRRHKADLDARRPFRGFRFTITWPGSDSVQHFSASGKPIFDDEGRFQGYRGTVSNETEAVVASQRARMADRLLRDAVDSISEGFVIFDAEDRLVLSNEGYRRMYPEIADLMVPGTSFEAIVRAGVARGQFADAENREEEWIAERIRRHHHTEGSVEQRLSGDRWALASERRMSDGGIAGLRIDISALKKAQVALKESQMRLNEAEKIAQLGCSDYNLATDQLTWSSEAYRIFGLDPRQAPPIGETYLAMVEPRDRERLHAVWIDLNRGIKPEPIEYWITRPDGQSRLIHRDHEIMLDKRGTPMRIVSTLQDVTEQRASEQRSRELERLLIHSQKLEALGTMAGGMAHELNNILAPVLSLAKVALEDFPADSATRQDLEMVVIASQRARDLVRQVLAFGRKQAMEKRLIEPAATVHQTLRMMRATVPASIELVELLEPVPAVYADPDQLQQVIVNLVTNAQQAIGERIGKITISLTQLPNPADQNTRIVRLAVADDGCGMEEILAQRIFEPFFTTREADRGSGLGLSVVHGIVTSHGGQIELRTAPGQGSEFAVVLPAAERRELISLVQSAA